MTAPPQPAAPRDAGVGERERVSVDAAAWAELEAAFQRAAEAGTDWEWKAEAVDHLLWPAYDNLQATARPLPVGGAVDAATLAEWTATIARYRAAGDARGQFGDPLVANLAAIAERAIAALATPPPAPVAVPDRAAVEAARSACEQAAADAARAGALWTVGLRDARRAFDALVFPAAPAHDADAAGENGGGA